MTVADWQTLISTLGFPIVACIYLAYSNEKLRATIEENTRTIESLKTLISTLHNMREG